MTTLGGHLLMADVLVDGTGAGVHWWNRLPSGAEVDLTCQFLPDELVLPPRKVERPPLPRHRARPRRTCSRATGSQLP